MSADKPSLLAWGRRHRVLLAVAFLMLMPWLLPYEALAVNILIYGLFAVGFNLLFGYTGLLSFGHASFLGVGSYLAGMSIVHGGLSWWLAILVGIASATAAGAVIGFLAIRTRGIYFAMVTLALGQIVYYLFYKAEAWTGGENGLRGIRIDPIDLFGWRLDFFNPTTKYYVMALIVGLALWFVSRVLNSPFGAVIETIRENEKRAAACGYDVARSKWLAFVLSAGVCGLAGASARAAPLDRADRLPPLPAVRTGGDDEPAGRDGHLLRTFHRRGRIPLPGGHRHQCHPLLDGGGGSGLHPLRALLPARHLGIADELAGTLGSAAMSTTGDTEAPLPVIQRRRYGAAILRTEAVSRHFGAFVALRDFTVDFPADQLTAIIGPNGAGKSTFFNVISGSIAPTSGKVWFEGRDISHLKQHEFARIGIAKSFQITNVFKQLSAHENVRVAAQAMTSRFDIWRPRGALKELKEQADALLNRVGLAGMASKPAADLAHGQQRALEIAMALAARPKLLLMDEPTAGMSPEETRVMMDLIVDLAAERTIILVEHKMKLVMGICQRLIVLHQGALLAQGTPSDIRGNDEVRRVYLGQG